MRFQSAVFYYTETKRVPWKNSSTIWVSVLGWCVGASGNFTEAATSDQITINFYKKGTNPILVRSYTGLLPGKDGMYNDTVGVPWKDGDYDYLDKMLTIEIVSPYGTVTPYVWKAPFEVGPLSHVFVEAAKIGVLVMTSSTNQPMDTIFNQIYDAVRRGIQVVPGEPQSYFASTNPASGGSSWGTAHSFGFEAVGVMITNLSASQTVEFSLDGTNVAGRVPPSTIKAYDFRRASQIYFRATTSDPEIEVEAW